MSRINTCGPHHPCRDCPSRGQPGPGPYFWGRLGPGTPFPGPAGARTRGEFQVSTPFTRQPSHPDIQSQGPTTASTNRTRGPPFTCPDHRRARGRSLWGTALAPGPTLPHPFVEITGGPCRRVPSPSASRLTAVTPPWGPACVPCLRLQGTVSVSSFMPVISTSGRPTVSDRNDIQAHCKPKHSGISLSLEKGGNSDTLQCGCTWGHNAP